MGNGNHQIFFINQISNGQVTFGAGDLGETLVAIFFNNGLQLFSNNLQQTIRIRQNLQKTGNLLNDFSIFVLKFFSFQTGQAMQTQVQNGLSLIRRQMIKPVTQPVDFRQIIWATGVFASLLQHRHNAF